MDKKLDRLLLALDDEIEKKCCEIKKKRSEQRLASLFVLACIRLFIVYIVRPRRRAVILPGIRVAFAHRPDDRAVLRQCGKDIIVRAAFLAGLYVGIRCFL
jgi:hypothetical protein